MECRRTAESLISRIRRPYPFCGMPRLAFSAGVSTHSQHSLSPTAAVSETLGSDRFLNENKGYRQEGNKAMNIPTPDRWTPSTTLAYTSA